MWLGAGGDSLAVAGRPAAINAAALRLHLQAVPVSDIVPDPVASAGPVAAAKRVQLSEGVAAGPPLVAASLPELGRVLRNLLSNAIRHTRTASSISRRTSRTSTSCCGWQTRAGASR